MNGRRNTLINGIAITRTILRLEINDTFIFEQLILFVFVFGSNQINNMFHHMNNELLLFIYFSNKMKHWLGLKSIKKNRMLNLSLGVLLRFDIIS